MGDEGVTSLSIYSEHVFQGRRQPRFIINTEFRIVMRCRCVLSRCIGHAEPGDGRRLFHAVISKVFAAQTRVDVSDFQTDFTSRLLHDGNASRCIYNCRITVDYRYLRAACVGCRNRFSQAFYFRCYKAAQLRVQYAYGTA